MKLKSTLCALSLLIGATSVSNAAVYTISNVGDFLTDRLYADNSGALMNSGTVAIGYFPASVQLADINTIAGLVSNLGLFISQSTAVPGTLMGTFGISVAGYADNADLAASSGIVTVGNPLLNRPIYSIVTNASSLALATATSQFALVQIGVISDDVPNEQTYTSNPLNAPIIGSLGTFNGALGIDFDGPGGEPALGAGTYSTLRMDVIPEPSAALLGAFGVLGLLRRRRN